MQIVIEKILGSKKYIFTVDGATFGDAFRNAAKLDLIPSQCDCCGSTDLSLTYRKPQGFEYPGVKCNACKAQATIHTKKDNSEDYLSRMEKYIPKGEAVQPDYGPNDVTIKYPSPPPPSYQAQENKYPPMAEPPRYANAQPVSPEQVRDTFPNTKTYVRDYGPSTTPGPR
jgi:hypothetical protein